MPGMRERWGELDGQSVWRATLRNASGMQAHIVSLGATLQRLTAPTSSGAVDLVLGYDTPEEYRRKGGHLGATAGRFANRIGHGRLVIDGGTWQLPLNEDGLHHLHGGPEGFGKRLWDLAVDGSTACLSLVSEDGDQGYPGRVEARCVYSLRDDDVLEVEMTATADAATPLNLAHHSYWNLGGADGIEEHELEVDADRVLGVDEHNIPTGAIVPVAGTELDFRTLRPLGRTRIDHCYVLRPAEGVRRVALLRHPASGRRMELWADQPGVQVYTGFKLDTTGYGGRRLAPHSGVCLETEEFPDAMNHPEFPSAILRPGSVYRHRMEHRFVLP